MTEAQITPATLLINPDGTASAEFYRFLRELVGPELPLSLANGGTGVELSDPGGDRLLGWDDTAGSMGFVAAGAGLSLDAGILSVTAGIVLGTPVTASGTAVDFSIPSTARVIHINLVDLSTNGTSNYLIQLGTSGVPEATGYKGAGFQGGTTTQYTNGLGFPFAGAANILHGQIDIYLENAATFSWTMKGMLASSASAAVGYAASSKALAAALDLVRVTTVNGTDVFDAGEVNISYE